MVQCKIEDGWLVAEDVARELARIDLPLSTYTQWYWKIDLHNLFHFLSLRADPHAQWEIQEYARVMAGMMKRVAPLSYEAWIDYNVCAHPMSRAELDALRRAGKLRRKPTHDPAFADIRKNDTALWCGPGEDPSAVALRSVWAWRDDGSGPVSLTDLADGPASSASGEKLLKCLPSSAAYSTRKWLAISMTSPLRSRSGGRCIGITCSL